MAKIYSPPAIIPVPKYDWKDKMVENYNKAEKTFIDNLTKFAKRRKKGDLIGKVIKFPVADGYALYMVAGLKPVELIHLPLLDAYQSEFAELMTAAKIKEMVERDEKMAELFSKKG